MAAKIRQDDEFLLAMFDQCRDARAREYGLWK